MPLVVYRIPATRKEFLRTWDIAESISAVCFILWSVGAIINRHVLIFLNGRKNVTTAAVYSCDEVLMISMVGLANGWQSVLY